MEILDVEPDPTYEDTTMVRASGGARRLFSRPQNIEMFKFSIERIKAFSADMAVDGNPAPIDCERMRRCSSPSVRISGCSLGKG